MAGTLKVDSINADSNLALKIANTAVAFIDATGLRPVAGNLNLDATATSKFYLPSANTVAIQTAGVTAVTVDSSQNVTLAGTLTTTGITNSGVATGARFNPTGSSVTGNGMYLPAANSLGLSTNGTNAVYIDSSQKVGIGTASPAYKLDVVGSVNVPAESSYVFGAGADRFIKYRAGDNDILFSSDSGDFYQQNIASSYHAWFTGNTERMRIASDGAVVIGKTVVDDTTEGFAYRASKYLMLVRDGAPPLSLKRLSDNGEITQFYRIGTQVGSISVTASATAYNTSSDYRLKENIAPMTGALAKVALLKPVTYKWKVDGLAGQGFIAHELAEVEPGCVSGTKDEVDADGNPKYQGVDTSFLVATLTAAIQELKAINDTQAETITALTARIVALESK